MRKTEELIWIGEQREISGHGVFSKGDKLNVPESIEKSLIRQGLAKVQKIRKVKEGK